MKPLRLTFDDVHKAFGSRAVLRGVSLDVAPGSLHFVLGVSGAGKSVLIKHAVGLCRADAGRIVLDGRDITALSEAGFAEVRAQVQYIFQHSALFEALSVQANVALPLRHRFRLSRHHANRLADASLQQLHLTPMRHVLVGELGAGVQKRVAIARALALQPQVLLYDEPTTSLDPVAARRTDRLMAELSDLGVTQLVVSHDMVSARAIAQRVTFLHDGRVHFDGAPETFFAAADDPVLKAFVRA